MDEEGCGEGAAWPGVCLALTNLQATYPSRMRLQVPSYIAFQETPLQSFWPAVLFVISIAEVFSVFTFNSPFGGELWSVRSDYASGNLGWDPLGLKPTGAAELQEMQTKEINNGRSVNEL